MEAVDGPMDEASKKEFVKHLLDAALEKWGEKEVASIRSALERTAEAIWEVEGFELELEDEPVTRVNHHLGTRDE